METLKKEYSHIKGWGIDNDPDDTPNYPIKNWTGDDHKRIRWDRPTLQKVEVELLKSTERPTVSAVFGSKSPPRGLSGVIRRYAFKYSENEYKHWLPLMLADRIDVIEGLIEDIINLKFPRLVKERGWYALVKHAPALLARKIAVRLAVVGAVVGIGAYKMAK